MREPSMMMGQTRSKVLVLLLTGLCGLVAHSKDSAHADTLYSIQTASDSLVTVDPVTGVVTVVGPIGRDVNDTDLVALGGLLWVSDAHNGHSSSIFTDLLALNPNTGAVLCSARVTWVGSTAPSNNILAEGLTSLDGTLRIAFTDSTITTNSDHLGVVSPFDGTISSVFSEDGFLDVHGHQADMDGLGTTASGMIIGVDAVMSDCDKCSELHTEPGYLFLMAYGSSSDPVWLNDITMEGPQLLAIDHFSFRLHTIDPITYDLVASVLLSDRPVLGLAAVGAPGTLFTLVVQESAPDTLLSWPNLTTAMSYDVVRGDLGILRSTGGDFTAATQECLASSTSATSLAFSGVPSLGEGYWFLVRAKPCGTYDSGMPSQVGARDAEIALSGHGCP